MTLLGSESPTAAHSHRLGREQAWFAFAMTLALMIVDYLDRQVIVSLFPHIKQAWGISDRQLGALVSVISVTVALAGVPIALLADRWSRVRSIAVMAVIWSLATLSCVFTSTYSELFTARAIVGLGEAGYGSAGAALIASLFPARMRGGLLAAFFASASVGSVLGVMLGGLIAAQWGWQSAFGVVAVPGLALALVYLRVPDYHTIKLEGKGPARVTDSGSLALALRALFSSRTMLLICLGSAAQLIVVSSIWAWLPSYLGRFHGVTPAVAGVRAALVVLLGAAGSMVWGVAIDRVGAEQPRRKLYGLATLCLITLLLLVPTFAATGLSNIAQLTLIGIGGFMMTCAVGPAAAIVMDVTHEGLRATGASVLSLFQNLMGLAAGPLIAGELSDTFGLNNALTVIPLFSALAAVLFLVASLTYESDLQSRTTRTRRGYSPIPVSRLDRAGAPDGQGPRTPGH